MSPWFKPSASQATAKVWETSADWDNATSESGVVHESTADTDHTDATIVKQGYPYGSFDLITPTPVSTWPFHEDSGSTANDLAGTNDGTINSVTIGATGLLGTSAYSFDSTSEDVTVGDVSELEWAGSEGYTFTAWIYINNSGVFAGKYDGSGYYFQINSSDQLKFYIRDSGSTLVNSGHTDNALSLGEWHHVGVTQTGTANPGDFEMFVDGTSVSFSTADDGLDSFVTSDESFTIGGRGDGATPLEDGDIADVRIYDSALSEAQIQTLYDVVDTAGSLTTATKSFSSGQKPNLIADVSLNTVASFDVDVIGSPSGTSETNTVTVDMDGENTYSITWSSSHTDFRVKPKLNNGGDYAVTPTVNKLELSP